MHNLNKHFIALIPGITMGRVVAFMGAGVNSCARAFNKNWKPGCGYLPIGSELFRYLAGKYEYPLPQDSDLVRLTQYISVVAGRSVLYDEMHRVFAADYSPSVVHRFFAALPKLLNDKGYPSCHQLVVTPNYDDMMELAFQEAGEPYDVISYIADGPNRGKFLHRIYQGDVRLIERIKKYQDIDLDSRSLVLKIHGGVDRLDPERDSYVITEDDYIEYLIRADITNLLPRGLVIKLQKSHFLFLGYGLRDWNLRVILHRIWGEQKLTAKSWAIIINPDEVESTLWGRQYVEILDEKLEDYISALDEEVRILDVMT